MKRELGKMEMAQAICNEAFVFNAVVILRMTRGPTEKTLRTLLDYLQHRYPLLGVHIHREKKRWFFEREGTPPIPLTVVSRENNNHWLRLVEEEMDRKFDLSTGPLVRFTYLTGSDRDKESEIIITVQHSIMDAVSGAYLVHEMLSFCQEIESHGSIEKLELLEPLPLLPPAEVFFPLDFQGWRRKWKTAKFLLRQIGSEFRYRLRIRGKRVAPVHPAGKNQILPMTLPKETTSALIKRAFRRRVTLNNLLNAAFMLAVHKHLFLGTPMPLRHINTVDLRPYLKPPLEPHYFGSYFAMLLSTIDIKENMGLWELAREINEITYTALKRGDKFCSHLLSYRMMRMMFRFKSMRMCNTALSFTGPLMLEKTYGKLELRDVHAFPSNFPVGPEYSAVGRIFDDRLSWDILYLDCDMDENQARKIAVEISTLLETAAEEEEP